MFDKSYYDNLKKEIQEDYQKVVNEAYEDIERVVLRKLGKQKSLEAKLRDTELKEKESLNKKELSKK